MKKIRKDNLVYVDDILSAIKKINKFCKGIEREDFMENELVMDAVVRNLEIIGEASSKLTPTFREKHKGIEWRKIIGRTFDICLTFGVRSCFLTFVFI